MTGGLFALLDSKERGQQKTAARPAPWRQGRSDGRSWHPLTNAEVRLAAAGIFVTACDGKEMASRSATAG